MDADYDVVIVGGGMVGAAMACALAGHVRTALIDAAEPPPAQPAIDYDDRTVALAYGSKRILETLGVWPALAGRAARIDTIHISDRGRFGFTRLTAADSHLPALGYVVANRAVAGALYAAAQTPNSPNSKVSLFAPASMQGVMIDDGGVNVVIAAPGGTRSLRARLLIAADGADSAVRQTLGMAAQRLAYDQSAIVTAVTPSRPVAGVAYERFTADGPLALLPAADSRYVVIWSLPAARAEQLSALDDAAFIAALQEAFGDRLGEFLRVGRRQRHPLALTHVGERVRPRVVLIGNAAHTVHPVVGQGFNLGLRDVAVLAQVVVEATRCGDDIGAGETLTRYSGWRTADTNAVEGLTHSLLRLFSNDYLSVTLARDVALLAVDLLPPVKRRFVALTSGVSGRLPRLARGLPL